MDYNTASYLCHHGVKGMKWGVRKDRVKLSSSDKKIAKIDKKISKNEAKIAKYSSKKHGTARYERMKNLELTNDYHKARKNEIAKKQAYKNAKGTSKESSAKNSLTIAKAKRQEATKNANREVFKQLAAESMGYGSSARGSYYRSREMGRSRVNSALRATGKQTVMNLTSAAASKALVTAGAAAVGYYVKRKMSNGSSVGALPAYEILQAKHVKVRTIK